MTTRNERRTASSPARLATICAAVLLSGAGLLLTAGCSRDGSGSASSSMAPGAFAASGTGHAVASAPRAEARAAGQGDSVAAARLTPSSQSIIYTATMTLGVTNAAAAAARASSYVAGAGGYTSAEQAQTADAAARRPRVSLTLKVPVAGYPAALRWLAQLGTQTALRQQSTDVTEQVADVSSRLTSEQDAIAQLRMLLRRAGSVSGLLSVQQQISSDESSLEALQAQQRALDRETSYATVTVLLLGPAAHPAGRHAGHRRSFLSGLAAGWHGLRHAVAWLLTALGLLLPFALVLAALGGLGWLAWRRAARRRAAPTQAG